MFPKNFAFIDSHLDHDHDDGTNVTIGSGTIPDDIINSSLCAEWSTKRILIEVFLVVILIENVFSMFVIATTTERRGNPFIIRCIRVINVASLLMILQLLFYPFVFSWNNLEDLHDEHDHQSSDLDNSNQEEEAGHNVGDRLRHPCQQASTAACKISGLLFGVFLFLPLLTVVLMTVDTALAAFRWKMYRFRPGTTSNIRIALFVGFTIALVVSFMIPSFELGTHYHFHSLFKICWLSVHQEDYEEEGYTYFIFGFGCCLVFLVCLFGYLVLRAYKAELSPLKQMIGHQCTMLFGRYVVMKSQSWVSYVRFVMWMDIVVIAAYFPLTAGYIIKFQLNLADTYWFNLATEVCVFFLPTAGPVILVIFYESHRKRAMEILWKCCSKSWFSSHGHQRISPIPAVSSSSEYSIGDTCSESSYKHTQNDSPGLKLYSDSLKKQLHEENKRRISNPFNKHDRLKPSSPNAIHKSRYPKSSCPNIQVDLTGLNSLQELINFTSSERSTLNIPYQQTRRKSLPGPISLYPAALPQRRRSHERQKEAQQKGYHHLHLSPRTKRSSPRNSREKKSKRHSAQFIPDIHESPRTRRHISNNLFSDSYQNKQEDRHSKSRFELPPPYNPESSSYQGSAFSHGDEQGYMWSSDYLRSVEGPHRKRSHSNASLLMKGFESSNSSQNF